MGVCVLGLDVWCVCVFMFVCVFMSVCDVCVYVCVFGVDVWCVVCVYVHTCVMCVYGCVFGLSVWCVCVCWVCIFLHLWGKLAIESLRSSFPWPPISRHREPALDHL